MSVKFLLKLHPEDQNSFQQKWCATCHPPPQKTTTTKRKKKRASPMAQTVKNLVAVQETSVWSLSQEDPLEKETEIHTSILAWRIPWTEEPGCCKGQRSLWGCKESDKTEWLTHTHKRKRSLRKVARIASWQTDGASAESLKSQSTFHVHSSALGNMWLTWNEIVKKKKKERDERMGWEEDGKWKRSHYI